MKTQPGQKNTEDRLLDLEQAVFYLEGELDKERRRTSYALETARRFRNAHAEFRGQCLSEELAWYDGRVYTGQTVKAIPGGWRIVVRATTTQGHRQVTFAEAPTYYTMWENLYRGLRTVGLKWQRDKYAG